MATKASHIQEPLERDKDVIKIDSVKDADTLAVEMTAAIQERAMLLQMVECNGTLQSTARQNGP